MKITIYQFYNISFFRPIIINEFDRRLSYPDKYMVYFIVLLSECYFIEFKIFFLHFWNLVFVDFDTSEKSVVLFSPL